MVVIGVGGHAREALDVIEAMNVVRVRYRVIGLIDDDATIRGSTIRGYEVLGPVEWLLSAPTQVRHFIGVGNCFARMRVAQRIAARADRSESLVHPTATVGSGVTIGRGCLLAPGVVVTTNVRIGHHAHVNTSATVSHDCTLGNFVHVSPGAHLAGNVTLGEGCHVGVGACIIQDRRVGAWSTVGAGAVVIQDVPADVTVAGVPAREISRRSHSVVT